LFLELYSAFCEEELPEASTVEGILRSYVNDYCQDMMEQRIREGIDPELDFATDIILNSDLSDLRYLYRYGEMHIDLMDKMSLYNGYQRQKLDTIASLCGFAGKGDIDGSQVVPMVQAGDWQKLTAYCESDVLNTWLIYLRWLILTGKMDTPAADGLIDATYGFVESLTNGDGSLRHQGFLDAWVR